MRYLGIDYGSKRVGIALSDPSGSYAIPHRVLRNDSDLIVDIEKICRDNQIGTIVVGESKDYSLKDNTIMKEINPFVEKIKSTLHLPVFLHPEFLTSHEAVHLQGKNEMLDASAAALILKSYLESNKK